MKNKYISLRHAETIKDPKNHPKDWLLTPDGLDKIKEHISNGGFNKITIIVSSTELKAVATGKPIAEFLGLPIEEMEEFVEVKREKKFLTDQEFLIQKQKELEMRNKRVNGVESGNEAILRFESGIQKLEEKYSDENILIITHGTIMTLYLANLNNSFENIFQNWKDLKFCELFPIQSNTLNQSSINLYDNLGTQYAEYVKKAKTYHDSVDQLIFNNLIDFQNRKINWLDIGSAEGNRISKITEKYSTDLTCTDNSPVMVDLLKNKNLKAFVSDVSNKKSFNFNPKEFDIVSMLYNVLGQIETPRLKEEALRNIKNTLKDNGVLIFDVSNKWNFKRYKKLNVLKSMFWDLFGLDSGDFKLSIPVGDKQLESVSHCFTYFEIKKMLRKTGFKIRKKYFVNYKTGEIENNLFSGQILIFAEKI